MNIIDKFLQEDMLIVRPSVFIYVDKDKCKDVVNKGISLNDNYISCYLKRIPNIPEYTEFLTLNNPIRITICKLKKINDQKVKLIAKNISGVDEIDIKKDHIITQLQRKYEHYLDVCFKDKIPLENMPRIDLYLEKKILPGFVCKVLYT